MALGSLHTNATNPHRWICNDEILYCLQSIENYAPWVRTIWIVVDDETPDLTSLSDALRVKVKFVFHHEIFDGFDAVLPTFNSLAIETMLWRISGLSERFMYFNDDVFLTAPLSQEDVFRDQCPVLRGKWVDYSEMVKNAEMRNDPSHFNRFMQLNAAQILGFGPDSLFASAHVVHPLRRSVMARLFDQHRDMFLENIRYRFRDLNQFLPQALHNHACISDGQAVIHTHDDHRHIKSGYGIGGSEKDTRSLMQSATSPEVKFLCVNDLPQLEQVIPEARELLRHAIGGFPSLAVK